MEVPGRRDKREINVEVPESTKFIPSEHMDKYCPENLICQPCRLEGRTVSASQPCETCHKGFCSTCLTHHNRLFVTKRHSVSTTNEMSGINTLTDLSSENCDFHKDQKVNYFCQRHECMCCDDCLESQHRICKVFPIDNVSCYYNNSEAFQMIRKSMEQLKEEIRSSKNLLQYNLKAAMDNKRKVIEEIKTFREAFKAYLDKAERELVLEIDQLYINNVTVQKKILEYECVEKQMEDFQSKLEQCFDNTTQLYITAKRVHRRLQACQKVITETNLVIPEEKYNFEPSKHLLHLKQRQPPIGRISKHLRNSPEHSNLPEAKAVTDFHMKDKLAHFVTKLGVQVLSEKDCCITGLAMINAEEILLADTDNASLKILNIKDGKITSMIRPSGKPYDVTIIRPDTAAASLPDTGMILFVNTKHGLSQMNTLRVRNGCKGIAHHNGLLAVSFCQPSPAVQIMDMEGHTLHELKDTTMCRHPCNIALSNDGRSLFVSEFSLCTVIQFQIDDDLKIIANYETNTEPCGLAVTSDGTVIVCCVGDKEKVRMLVPRARIITVPLYLQDVQKPCSVLVCEQLQQMFICECNGSLDCNFIKIFSLK